MAKYEKSSGKMGWKGMGQSTPSSEAKSPKNEGSFKTENLSYRGVADSTPNCEGGSDKVTLRK